MNNTKYDYAISMENKKDKNSSYQAFVGGGIASVWVVGGGSSAGGVSIVFEEKWLQYV